jgi:hypothetical protein
MEDIRLDLQDFQHGPHTLLQDSSQIIQIPDRGTRMTNQSLPQDLHQPMEVAYQVLVIRHIPRSPTISLRMTYLHLCHMVLISSRRAVQDIVCPIPPLDSCLY